MQNVLFNSIFKMKVLNFSKTMNLIIESNEFTCSWAFIKMWYFPKFYHI